MSGYDGFSMSHNARAARRCGRMPASALAAEIGHGATAAGVRAVLTSGEWHHTSSNFNRTKFYDLDLAAAYRADDTGPHVDTEEAEQIARAGLVAEIIAASKAAKQSGGGGTVTVIESARVDWVTWSGSRVHPRAEKHHAANARVEIKGKFATVTVDGAAFRKMVGANGFTFCANKEPVSEM